MRFSPEDRTLWRTEGPKGLQTSGVEDGMLAWGTKGTGWPGRYVPPSHRPQQVSASESTRRVDGSPSRSSWTRIASSVELSVDLGAFSTPQRADNREGGVVWPAAAFAAFSFPVPILSLVRQQGLYSVPRVSSFFLFLFPIFLVFFLFSHPDAFIGAWNVRR